MTLAKYAMANAEKSCSGMQSIKLAFTDSDSPLRFEIKLEDGRKAEGLLMPMKLA
jgi:hypothetical protein